jgi:hypothetical protein
VENINNTPYKALYTFLETHTEADFITVIKILHIAKSFVLSNGISFIN